MIETVISGRHNSQMLNDSVIFRREKYELTLPENWCDVITQYPQMFTIDDCIADKIISPNHLLDAKPESNEETNENSYLHVSTEPQPLTVTITQMEIDELILPWKEKHWNVFITNPVSTVEVWARIIGPEYSVRRNYLNRLQCQIE